MTNDEYARLVEFVGRKFEEVEAQQVETRRHFDVVAERVQSQIQTVAEGVAATNERLDRFERRMEEGFAETRVAIRFSYAQLEGRIQELERNYASLHDRVARLESS